MPVIFTAIARVKDWQALQELNEERMMASAQALKAGRYQIYRNVNDASLALLWVELPDQNDVCEMRAAVTEQLGAVEKLAVVDERVWEPTGWQGIEGKEGGQEREE
jgi:hypothetical protein